MRLGFSQYSAKKQTNLKVTFVVCHLRSLGKWLYSATSGTPQRAIFMSSTVSSSSCPVTSNLKNFCISRIFSSYMASDDFPALWSPAGMP